jgi:hypothetical protein
METTRRELLRRTALAAAAVGMGWRAFGVPAARAATVG